MFNKIKLFFSKKVRITSEQGVDFLIFSNKIEEDSEYTSMSVDRGVVETVLTSPIGRGLVEYNNPALEKLGNIPINSQIYEDGIVRIGCQSFSPEEVSKVRKAYNL